MYCWVNDKDMLKLIYRSITHMKSVGEKIANTNTHFFGILTTFHLSTLKYIILYLKVLLRCIKKTKQEKLKTGITSCGENHNTEMICR